jgi:RNA polymerase sigma-70 factor (ECF subfamily)
MDAAPTQADWCQWLEDHSSKLLFFARQQSRRESDAQDLVQEAVIEAWQRQGNGKPPPLAQVYATLRRRAIDLARSENRRIDREQLAAAPIPEAWFDTRVEDVELSRLIQSAMTRLPDMYREVITLKVWGDLRFAEIADVLGIPANTAASRYRYGLEALRKLTKEVLA